MTARYLLRGKEGNLFLKSKINEKILVAFRNIYASGKGEKEEKVDIYTNNTWQLFLYCKSYKQRNVGLYAIEEE